MGITITCRLCKVPYIINVTQEQLDKWKSGSLIQIVMPELSAGDRELLISQTCDDCWKAIFNEEDEIEKLFNDFVDERIEDVKKDMPNP